jgi:hypothetical protein
MPFFCTTAKVGLRTAPAPGEESIFLIQAGIIIICKSKKATTGLWGIIYSLKNLKLFSTLVISMPYMVFARQVIIIIFQNNATL